MAGGGSVQKNKSHKTRFASKSQRTKHRLAKETVTAPSGRAQKHAGVHVTARAQRLNSAKVMREQKRAETLASKRSSSGPLSPPRILLLIGLNEQTDLGKLKAALLAACLSSSDDATSLGSVRVSKPPEEDTAMETDAGVDAGAGAGAGEVLPAEEGGQVAGLGGAVTVAVLKHKLRLTLLEASHGDAMGCLEKMKVADVIAFALPAVAGAGFDVAAAAACAHVDDWGRRVLSLARAQGVPSLVGLVQGLASVPPKRRAEAKKGALAALHEQFPDDCRGFPVDLPEDCQQLLRHLAEQRLSPPTWRTQRSYVVAHKVEYEASGDVPGSGSLLVSGYVRYKALSVNQIVHVSGAGDFHLAEVRGPDDPCPLQRRQRKKRAADVHMGEAELDGSSPVLATADPDLQEPIVVENAPDPLAGEQTWPTEEEMEAAGEERRKQGGGGKKKRVPKGTSDYQASWYIAESDEGEGGDDEDDNDDVDMQGGTTAPAGAHRSSAAAAAGAGEGEGEEEEEGSDWEEVEEGRGGSASRATSVWGDDHADRMAEDEDMTAAEREAERQRLKAAHQDDVEFPDEVDTPGDVAARQRFAKYRGLKSFRTSPWDSKELLPVEYSRIFAFENFKRTQKHVLAKAADVDLGRAPGCVFPGTFVTLRIASVPQALADKVAAEAARGQPVVVAALLQHETKMSVVHYAVRKSDTWQEPVRSKDELLFHSGFRRFSARPIFSTDDFNVDKHKFERFLHPGRFVVASVFAPISFPPAPLLLFKEGGGGQAPPPGGAAPPPALVATGALRGVDVDRIILKKIVLSGYPVSVQKRKAVVRFMFHTPEDVRWFKPVELFTKYGRRGRIKEPVGTKGNMKCIFDGTVQQRDAVLLALYKRIYPKWPEALYC